MKAIISIVFFMSALFASAQNNYPTIVISTNFGDMKVMLYDDTPNHSDHFLKLVKQGYFNGTLFHRVIRWNIVPTFVGPSIRPAFFQVRAVFDFVDKQNG